jgi:hypothetical protein
MLILVPVTQTPAVSEVPGKEINFQDQKSLSKKKKEDIL